MGEPQSAQTLQELEVTRHRGGTLTLSAQYVPDLAPHDLESDLHRAVLAPLDRALSENQNVTGVVLKGRFPLWFFAAAHLAIRGFVESALGRHLCWQGVFDPKLSGAVVVYSQATHRLGDVVALDTASTVPPRVGQLVTLKLRQREPDLSECVLSFTSPGQDLLRPSEVRTIVPCVTAADQLRQADLVLLDGQYPSWLATAIVLEVHMQYPDKAILIRALRDRGDVVVEPGVPPMYSRGLLLPYPKQELRRPPLVVGLIGDPNSGKSVLSLKLYHLLRGPDGVPCYRLDCDAYAPTAEWTLRGVGPQERKLWKEAKGDWTVEDERRLAQITRRIKNTPIDLLLLDLPGGNFQKEPPERIPPGRVALFAEVDRFILVAKDEQAKVGWEQALRVIGKSEAIAVIVRPDTKEVEETIGEEPLAGRQVRSIRIGQLDRERLHQITPGIRRLAAMLREEVENRP